MFPRAVRTRQQVTAAVSGIPTTTTLWSVVYAAAIAGDSITIGVSDRILMDMTSTPVYGSIVVNGLIVVDRSKTTALSFKGMTINSGGRYWAGDLATPYPRTTVTHTITPSGARSLDPFVATPSAATASNNRGILVMDGGELSLVAAVPAVTIVKLGATALSGASSIVTETAVTLKAGDRLEVGTSMYWQEGMQDTTAISAGDDGTNATEFGRRPGYGSEVVTVASDVNNSTTIPINASTWLDGNTPQTTGGTLQYRHHGQLQYLVPPSREDVVGTNLSYTPYTIQAADSFGTVNGTTITGTKVLAAIAAGANAILDNRSTVGLLTHPIKIQGANDTDWTTSGYGAHLMVMGLSGKLMLQGVEFNRVGQAGFLGRYPIHHHMRSYTAYTGGVTVPPSGTYLGDVDPTYNFVQYCSVYRSSNRGITIHGTCASKTYKNVLVDTDTHCIFLEDGSEERNVIDGNFIAGVGRIGYGATIIKLHDAQGPTDSGGPAGIWYTNPVNYLRNNIVSGAYVGIWNVFSYFCFGLSRDVAVNPLYLNPLEWDNNESHSCKNRQMLTFLMVTDELGTLSSSPSPGWLGNYDPYDLYHLIFVNPVSRAKLWKGHFWYQNRAFGVDYSQWTCSGLKDWNDGISDPPTGIAGVAEGRFNKGSFFSRTLDDYYAVNTANRSRGRMVQMTTYHNAVHRTNCIFVPSPMGAMQITEGALCKIWQLGGTLQMWDYYDNALDTELALDTGSVYLGANPGYPGVIFPPAMMLGQFSSAYTTALGISGPDLSTSRQHAAHKLPADGSMFGMAGGWWVFDDPFFTSGVTGAVYAEAPAGLTNLNGKLIPSTYNYLGLWTISASGVDVTGDTSGVYADAKPVYWARYQSDYTTLIGHWDTSNTPDHNYFPHRHCQALDGGYFDCYWSRLDVALPTAIAMRIFGPTYASPHVFVRFDWNGATAVSSARCDARGGETIALTNAGSFAALISSTTPKYWVDVPNNKIYTHVYRAAATNTLHDIEANLDSNLHTLYIN